MGSQGRERFSQMFDFGAAAPANDSPLMLSMLPLFDFDGDGVVTYSDWTRGVDCLGMEAYKNDHTKWIELTGAYGDGARNEPERSSIDLRNVDGIVPLDKHLEQLLRAVVFGIDHVKAFAREQSERNAVVEERNERTVR